MAMPIFLNHNLNFKKINKKSNLNSFRASLLTIFIYTSIFYIFNLSPSTLVHTTKFWFILSNTLILIIAADSRTFSSSSSSPKDLEPSVDNNVTTHPYNFPTKDHKMTSLKPHAKSVFNDQPPPERIISVVTATADPVKAHKKRRRRNEAAAAEEEKVDGKKMKEEIMGAEEDDEFSRMSDEEVNRRVEEFIRRFNRQIRVQAAINRRQSIS